MKKYLLASVAALGLVAAGAASAADLPSRKGPVAAPVYMPPAFSCVARTTNVPCTCQVVVNRSRGRSSAEASRR